MEDNNCRMYEGIYPNAEDLVVVQVKNVAEMGAYVSLLEYNGIEGQQWRTTGGEWRRRQLLPRSVGSASRPALPRADRWSWDQGDRRLTRRPSGCDYCCHSRVVVVAQE
jgi:hypothetical protein